MPCNSPLFRFVTIAKTARTTNATAFSDCVRSPPFNAWTLLMLQRFSKHPKKHACNSRANKQNKLEPQLAMTIATQGNLYT
jgi:hypothetical protein